MLMPDKEKEPPTPESPQVNQNPAVEIPSPEAAGKRRKERLAIESALLDRDDYTYQVFYTYRDSATGKDKETALTCMTLADARKKAKTLTNARIEKRIKKSGCRKFADFYRLCLPKDPVPHSLDLAQLGNFIFQTERGSGWIAVKVMRAEDLVLMKAEYSISVVTPDGRSYAGVGACAVSDGRLFKQPTHDIPATAFTRALNRAITEAVGWGAGPADEADDEQDHESPAAPSHKAQTERKETSKPEPEPEPKKEPAKRRKPEPKPVTAAPATGDGAAGPAPGPAPAAIPEKERLAPTQLNTIKVLAKQIGMADGQVDQEARAKHSKTVAELSQKEGFSFIHHLVSIKNRKAQSA
jgi:hypothetical protein